MKKFYLFLFILFSFFQLRNVYAISMSVGQDQAYISSESNIFKIMNDSNTTCSSYLDNINYDLYSQLGTSYEDYIIDFHYGTEYVSGESFTFALIEPNGGEPVLNIKKSDNSVSVVYLNFQGSNAFQGYKTFFNVDCKTGTVTKKGDKEKLDNMWNLYILEKRDIGYEFFPSIYQSSFGDIYFSSSSSSSLQNLSFELVGVYDNNLNEVKKMNDFVGSEYYSNSLLLGSGVALVPFYSVLSGDFGNVDIPYTGDYTYWYLNSDSALYFTPKENFYDDNVDTNLYMRPVILDQTLSSEELLNLFQFTEIKLGVYQDYQSSSKLTYSYYWNNSYNDFFIIDSSKLTSTSGMYQLVYSNANTFTNISLNQMIVYFDPRAWNVAHFNIRTNQQSVAVNGVNGTTWLYRGDVINSRSDLLQDNNIQNRPQYGNTSGDTGTGGISGLGGFGDFLNSLLGGISGIGEFISSVSGGISTLFESISSIVTLAFSVLNSLPLPVSSLLYLTFLLTIVAIILKIFL